MGAPWNQGVAEVEAVIEAVSLFLKDLPATSDPVKAGRCRRALARCRSSREGPDTRGEILRGIREDLAALGFKGRLS
jgi:hypothetical protein